jgi:asparagine synthase (glutamine-hydrolysing)
VASLLGTEHHELVLEPDVVPLVEDFAWFLDEPFGDTSAIATYMVSKLAAEHVKVVLTGDGGDEIFAGYDKYVVEERERAYDLMPASLRRAAGVGGRGDARRHEGAPVPPAHRPRRAAALPRRAVDRASVRARDVVHAGGGGADGALRPVGGADGAPRRRRGLDVGGAVRRSAELSAARRADQGRSHDDGPLDRGTAAAARPPAGGVCRHGPPGLRYREGTTKYLFKQALRGVLPDSIIDRRKQGFAVPLARWFRGPLAGYARDVLLSESSRSRGVLNPAAVERQLQLHQRGRDLDLQLWTMLSFELWCRRFLDTEAVVS